MTEKNAFKNVFSLEGRQALVIGGGGLGKPIAQALLENGADVVVADKQENAADELCAIAAENGRSFSNVAVDLLCEDSICNMVQTAYAQLKRIDILVNAAGVNVLKHAEEFDTESWDFVLGINLRGVHLVTREVGKIMIRQQYGRILCISSVKSLIGTDRDYAAYCASKGGINMYTRQLACEWGQFGITANAIAPTFTRTPINAFQLDDKEFFDSLLQRIPCGRICTTRDIICAALFLCSDAAQFINGQILCVDVGLTAKQ